MEFDHLDSRPGKSWNFGPGHHSELTSTVAGRWQHFKKKYDTVSTQTCDKFQHPKSDPP